MNLGKGFRQIGRFLKRHRSTILSVIGVAGVVGTFVTTIAANDKANERRHEAMAEKSENLTKWERFKAEAPAYIIPGAICLVTAGSIAVNDIMNAKQRAGLIAMAAAGTRLYASLPEEQKKAISLTTAKKEEYAIPENTDNKELFYICTGLWDEEKRGTFFWATLDDVRCAELDVSNRLLYEGVCEFAQFKYSINSPDLPVEDNDYLIGWSTYVGEVVYGYVYPEFFHVPCVTEDGREYTIIEMPFAPHPDFLSID